MYHILKINPNTTYEVPRVINKNLPRALTIGGFDGIHLGHQAIISALSERVSLIFPQKKILTSVMIIEPLAREYFAQLNSLECNNRIMSWQHKFNKIKLLSQKLTAKNLNGVDEVIIFRFNKNSANLSALEFIHFLQNKLKVEFLLIGDDFHFGKNRQGNINFIRDNAPNIKCESFNEVLDNKNNRYSSTKIRKFLTDGEFIKAREFLGEEFKVCGRVQKGHKLARQLHTPTANIHFKNPPPLKGVFAGWVEIENSQTKLPAVINIGKRPTVEGNGQIKLEAHIIGFTEEESKKIDLYGKKICVSFLEKIRDEKKFANLAELKTQIKLDCEIARNLYRI